MVNHWQWVQYKIWKLFSNKPNLALVAIGGLLSTKSIVVGACGHWWSLSTKSKTESEWKKISQNVMILNFELWSIGLLNDLTKILSLGYDDLPYYLKPCILYFGIYPKDYSIHHKRLTRQWIAERSLVQDSIVGCEGKFKSFQVHDVLHGVIIAKAKDLNFFHFVHEGDESAASGITRRLSMDTRSNNVPRISNRNHIHTIHAFGEGGFLEPFMMGQLSSKSCLKVLELEGTSLNYAPSNLRNLVHLRYLNPRSTKVWFLPKFVGKLQNLENLDIKDMLVHELPNEINKLKNRNYQAEFSVLGFTIGVLVKKGIKNLTSLEVLTHVELDDRGINLIQEMRMLNMLRKLGLRRVRREYGNVICALAVEMTHQESLNITAIKIIKLESLCKLMRVL
ncbi:Disease resistance protein RPM1 [Glycine max]|nr:Disease resistance protein RPM1 [Glycine max]